MRYAIAIGLILCLVVVGGLCREIRVPRETPLCGTVCIAEWFYKAVPGEAEPLHRQFQIYLNPPIFHDADRFTVRIKAQPGDEIVLAPGLYRCDIWIFTPQVTIRTASDTDEVARIFGGIEVDADGVTLDRIAITGRNEGRSGHAIELNNSIIRKVTIRNCLLTENEWYGIRMIAPHGEIDLMQVKDCQILKNGGIGIEGSHVKHLLISGCTISDNALAGILIGRASSMESLRITGCTITANKVGVEIRSDIGTVEMKENVILGNYVTDLSRKE